MPGVAFRRVLTSEFKERRAINIINGAVNAFGNELLREFKKTTETWNHKPQFIKTYSTTKFEGPTVFVGTDDDIYTWVNDGTNDHPIFARNFPTLTYQRKYKRKTRPRFIGSTTGGKHGPWIRKKFVNHPGIVKPREFDSTIRKDLTLLFALKMSEAYQRATKATGHEYR